MQRFVCLLRAINVGGNNLIKMPALKECMHTLGLSNIQTYLQSGNVIFQALPQDIEELRKMIEGKIQEVFNLSITTFIYTEKDWRRISENIPFQEKDHRQVYITLLGQMVSGQNTDILKEKLLPEDEIMLKDGVIYCYFPNGYGNTKLTLAFVEKKLSTYATTRNKNTVEKLNEMLGEE